MFFLQIVAVGNFSVLITHSSLAVKKMSAPRIARGFLLGLTLPPIVTMAVLKPYFVPSHIGEIDLIKQEMEFVGWNIRALEERLGVAADALYVPTGLHQT